MNRIALVTDSTATIPDDLLREYDIRVAPQVVIFGEETLRDGVDITPDQFYVRLSESEVLPTTSQATVGAFKEIFEPLVAEDATILAFLISTGLSGTYQSAMQAKDLFPDARIEIVDSATAAMALGFQVLGAARAIKGGASAEEAIAVAKSAQDTTGVIFIVDTLEFLHRGGRIGGAARLLGTALNLKPLLAVNEGKIEALERVRTKRKATARLLEIMEGRLAGKDKIRIATIHAAAEADALDLLREAEARFKPIESVVSVASPAIGVHTGPGTLGLAYCYGI